MWRCVVCGGVHRGIYLCLRLPLCPSGLHPGQQRRKGARGCLVTGHALRHAPAVRPQAGVKPNVRTYTALIAALGAARQWERALATLRSLCEDASAGRVEPNAYTYSALLKAMGEAGQWALAEQVRGRAQRMQSPQDRWLRATGESRDERKLLVCQYL